MYNIETLDDTKTLTFYTYTNLPGTVPGRLARYRRPISADYWLEATFVLKGSILRHEDIVLNDKINPEGSKIPKIFPTS